MNILDIIFVVILALSAIRGLFRGFIVEVASLGGVILGVYLAITRYEQIVPQLERLLGDPRWATIAAYAVIFLGVLLAVSVAASLLRKVARSLMAGWLDHLGGGLFGLAKGGLICAVAFWLLVAVFPNSEEARTSQLAPYIRQYTEYLKEYAPKAIREFTPESDDSGGESGTNAPGVQPAPEARNETAPETPQEPLWKRFHPGSKPGPGQLPPDPTPAPPRQGTDAGVVG